MSKGQIKVKEERAEGTGICLQEFLLGEERKAETRKAHDPNTAAVTGQE